MTDARTAWIRVKERKRTAISWSAALGFYLVAMAIAALVASFRIDDLADFSGPVVVRLGSPEGIEAPRPVEQPAPAPETARPAQSEPPVPTPPQPALASAPKAAPTPVPVPSAATTPAVQPAASQPAIATPPAPVVIKGSESGNSYDMTIDAGSGRAGRSLYVPIMLFMPLPNDLPANFIDSIPDYPNLPGTAEQRKQIFMKSYEKRPDGRWRVRGGNQPKFDARPELWTMLEDTGYDLKNAEYKQGTNLKPVVILFKVSAIDSRGIAVLEDVLVESSSGISYIDEAVLYGFKRAEFSNSGAISIKGRFTYRF